MTDLRGWLEVRRGTQGRARRKAQDPTSPASVWHEQELLGGEVVDALVAVLGTRGCSHLRGAGGCSMCGYSAETPARPPTEEELLSQLRKVADQRRDARWVKLYTSGSMLDPDEVPPAVLSALVETFSDADMLTVESRAEHVTPERVAALGDPSRREVAIGLESACDAVLELSVSKGMDLATFRRAASIVREQGASLRAYLLLKPPFLTEAEAIEDAMEAAIAAAEAGATTVSLNPLNVQRGTLVEHLHSRGEYAPPWLWSVLEVLSRSTDALPPSTRLVSAPTGGGTPRGAHNCGRCDREVLQAIEFHRLSGDTSELERAPACDCQRRWRAQLELEGFMQGPFHPQDYRRP